MASARTVSAPPAAGVERVSKRTVRTVPAGSSPRRATTTPSIRLTTGSPAPMTWIFASVTLVPSTVALPGTYSNPAGNMTIARVLPTVTPPTRTTAWCDREVRHRRHRAATTS